MKRQNPRAVHQINSQFIPKHTSKTYISSQNLDDVTDMHMIIRPNRDDTASRLRSIHVLGGVKKGSH